MALPSIMAGLTSLQPGFREVDGGDVAALATHAFVNTNADVTAKAGGTNLTGTLLNYGATRISVCATTNDSVMFPPAIPGASILLYNGGGATAALFGQQANMGGLAAGDQICLSNTVTPAVVATGVTLASAAVGLFHCFTLGVWKQLLTA